MTMNTKIIVGIIVAIAVPVAAYAISPLFINNTIDEPLPTNLKTDMMADKMEDKSMMADKMSDGSMAKLNMISGMFVGVGDGIHDAQGTAKILQLDDGNKILRFEDFRSTNGPDLYVYLATDKSASDFVSLGPLKANIGNQNYQIPEGTDLSKYDTALVWCKQFSVLFGSAELS
ncbi:Secreted protein [Candidatus Nitrosotenuis uzonensis]|uniref:Secreted protein n=2 Tax=Candidatus Nitrosotenuis uzonensis TaxID=1407055 RepID=V6ARQ6_9ARCH|nr:Secreted protein [Candidatus Nitrosotenuis uzonensis]